jgi:hypothetical protein
MIRHRIEVRLHKPVQPCRKGQLRAEALGQGLIYGDGKLGRVCSLKFVKSIRTTPALKFPQRRCHQIDGGLSLKGNLQRISLKNFLRLKIRFIAGRMLALSDSQLETLMTFAADIPPDKRSMLLERIEAMLRGPINVKTACPLYPRKQTCAVQLRMSAKGHKRTTPARTA